MCFSARSYLVNNIKLPINASFEEAFSVARAKFKKIGINTRDASFSVYKRSVDARNKSNIVFVYTVAVSGELPHIDDCLLSSNSMSRNIECETLNFVRGTEALNARPIVVGTGPCGLFAALLLAEEGYRPLVLERGSSVSDRRKSVEIFRKKGILDENSNIQFGAGGAGTFSDGKLITRINDIHSSYVMKRLVEFGAPAEILFQARPHIGTDILSEVVDKVLNRITECGGEIMYNTLYIASHTTVFGSYAETSAGNIPYGALILAVGHSARDTYQTLIKDNFQIEAKSFSVGMRIEHLTEDIDRAMYGNFAGNPALGHAEYNLSHNTKERGVYTFCMCPGGEVVAAASESGGLVVNGMSEHSRSGSNSNSAVVCSVFREDYGATPQSAIDFQRKIERAAFTATGSDYSAPIVTVGDFINGKIKAEPTRIQPTYRGGKFTRLVMPEKYLPKTVTESIKNALLDFDNKIKGFAVSDALLTGAETRTSAPIRILRDNTTRLALGRCDIYPAGEGAGYAGGITSAAIDGIKTAIAVINRFKN